MPTPIKGERLSDFMHRHLPKAKKPKPPEKRK
jgi:hypothetical protein